MLVGVQSAEEPVLWPAAAREPAALAPALYLTWLIGRDMTPGHWVTPVLGRGTFRTALWNTVVSTRTRGDPTCAVSLLVSMSVPFLSWADRQLGREWPSSLTVIRAKLQRGGTATMHRVTESW